MQLGDDMQNVCSAQSSETQVVQPAHSHRQHSGRAVLNISQAEFKVPVKKWGRTIGEKQILKGISMKMYSGETLAVMGPSGAGKTTFMDLLTMEGSGGVRTGSVHLNFECMTPALFKKYCAYVPQHDNAWPFLSCRESLRFAADFVVSADSACKTRRVDELLAKMGLESCQHTKVGNEFLKGLSGGQKRRLSLAIAFLKDPLVVFLDEVTSGLDAAASASIASFLQDLARSQDVIIACTIHQPSARIFKGFDRLLLLSDGRVAYSGKVSAAVSYFATLGLHIPDQENPADFFLDSVNSDFTDKATVEHLLTAWAERPNELNQSGSFALKAEPQPLKARSFFAQVWILLRRMALLVMRDPTVYVSRVVAFSACCTFFAIVYIKSRDRTQEQAFNRLWLILWHIGVPAQMSLVACLGQNVEFAAVRREVKAGLYDLNAYFFAQMFIQIPLLFVMSLSAIGISGYCLANWNHDAFLGNLLVHTLILFAFECVAQFFGVQFANPLLGMLNVIQFWFASFLFGGFLVSAEDTPWPLRAFTYISPIKYGSKAMIYFELHGTSWEDAVVSSTDQKGFSCTADIEVCFGATGDQVLLSMREISWKHLVDKNETVRDCLILLSIGACFRLLYFVLATVRCRNAQLVKQPACEQPASLSKARFGGSGSPSLRDDIERASGVEETV